MNKLIVAIGICAMIWVCNDHPAKADPHFYDVKAMNNLTASISEPENYVFMAPKVDPKGGTYVWK